MRQKDSGKDRELQPPKPFQLHVIASAEKYSAYCVAHRWSSGTATSIAPRQAFASANKQNLQI
jgi:hypothetical protein